MKTMHFSALDVTDVSEADVARIAARLERDDYEDAFEGLKDWHVLRAIAFQRPEIVEPYLYLLDVEAYDES